MQANYPNLEDFKRAIVADVGAVEVIKQSLYDTLIYPLAGVNTLRFFQTPLGQGAGANGSAQPGNAGAAKHLADTNMDVAGQLPAPQAFWIQSIEVDVQPGSTATANQYALQLPKAQVAAAAAAVQAGAHDVNAIYSTGALTLTIGQKPYLRESPLLRFPPKARFELNAASASNSATAVESIVEKLRAGGRPYTLNPGLGLMSSMNFDVTLSWPVIVPTPSGFNARVMVKLDGWTFRAVQ